VEAAQVSAGSLDGTQDEPGTAEAAPLIEKVWQLFLS
jgi:hypothetical protein